MAVGCGAEGGNRKMCLNLWLGVRLELWQCLDLSISYFDITKRKRIEHHMCNVK